MKKYILIFSILAILTACDKNNEEAIVDFDLFFTIVDQDGNDLLNPSTENSIEVHKIEIYHLKNGEYIRLYNNTSSGRNAYSLREPEAGEKTGYILGIALSVYEEYEKNKSVTVIKWNENESDTIISTITTHGNITGVYEFTYNNISDEDLEKVGYRTYKLVKERKGE
ncbi:hypothetical protein GGR21_003301 [Dysgonomonas hofstadii]|uniref:Type IV secretion system putative lipoprotein virB7 n=1 Tax=Dysgonomonas hofstadii TaxID=637886 RepID=A0A840CUM3_9BACT|nr:membrane lipoprotein lipid attachment site-containing protein [Dysgonomonas hofstadii]MBB4037384.1 hypothetical protein [Dysgonomonas hofstadii]